MFQTSDRVRTLSQPLENGQRWTQLAIVMLACAGPPLASACHPESHVESNGSGSSGTGSSSGGRGSAGRVAQVMGGRAAGAGGRSSVGSDAGNGAALCGSGAVCESGGTAGRSTSVPGLGDAGDAGAETTGGGGAPVGAAGEGGARESAGSGGVGGTAAGGGIDEEGPPPRIRLAAGNHHTCALLDDGTVRCWGANYLGQLGNGTTGPATCLSGSFAFGCATTPVVVSELTDAKDISLGNYHTCAVRHGGSLKCWGLNDNGQLGLGTSAGPEQCTGSDYSLPCSKVPASVTALSGVISGSAADESHTCAALTGGSIRCWGLDAGQFGTAEVQTTCGEPAFTCATAPLPVPDIDGVRSVRSATFHTCALRTDRSVWCWGYSIVGEIGNGSPTQSLTPVPVSNLADAVALASGSSHSCAIRADKTVWCWGSNSLGQLGTGSNVGPSTCEGPTEPPFDIPCSAVPVPVSDLTAAVAISVGGTHACAVLEGGSVACWGANQYGQLGVGTTSGPTTCLAGWDGTPVACSPVPLVVPNLHDVISVAAGGEHTCAGLADGSVRCWGWNLSGQLGNGTTVDAAEPVVVEL